MGQMDDHINQLTVAIYTVNRHAKAAPRPKHLYALKKAAIDKLIRQGHAKKIGLQYSRNPRNSVQHSTLLVEIGDYHFHTIPSNHDKKKLKHLGEVNLEYRNPKTYMSLSHAKKLLYEFLHWKEPQKKQYSSYYIPSSLGQWNGHRR